MGSLNVSRNEIVESWEFINETPAGGQAYFSEEKDMSAIIYMGYIKLSYDRETDGKTACCFANSKVIES